MTFRFLGLNGVRYLKNKVMQMINSAISSVTPSSIGAVPTSASCNKNWYWSGQGGQPSWLWGGNNANDCYVYNPSNFSVNYANSAGNANTLDNLDSTAFCKSNDARLSNARPTEIKELWRGTLTSGGTITVPGISQYNGKIFIVNRAAFVTLVDGYLYGMGYDVASTIGYNIYAVRLRVIGDTVQHTDPNGYNYNFAFAHNSNGGHTAMTYTTITSIGVLL